MARGFESFSGESFSDWICIIGGKPICAVELFLGHFQHSAKLYRGSSLCVATVVDFIGRRFNAICGAPCLP